MSEKPDLKALHYERLKRELKTYVDKSVGPDEEFRCAVCYTDGKESGLVTPACCSHKICLACYTKIVCLNKEKATCPECRTLYIPKTVDEFAENAAAAAAAENDEYYGMPPLIEQHDLGNYIINNNINNIIRNNLIHSIISAAPEHYDLIDTILIQIAEGHTR